MAQQRIKTYLDDSGNAIKNEPDIPEGTLDTAPSLKFNNQNINPEVANQLETTNRAKAKTYLNDSGEPVSDNSNELENKSNITVVDENEPDTWTKGFINSILGGEALDAGMQGAKGFAKGAILDIPEGIINAVKSAPGLMKTSMGPLGDMIFGGDSASDLTNMIRSIPAGIQNMYESASSNPEEFGRTMGQMTGQPLTTYGLAKVTPPTIRLGGALAEIGGGVMRKHAPITATPIIGPMAGRGLTRAERMVGSGIENIGKRMRSVGTGSKSNTLAEQILPEEMLDEIPTSKPNLVNQITEADQPFELPAKSTSAKSTAKPSLESESINSVMGKPIDTMRTGELIRIQEIKELPKEILDAVRQELDFRVAKSKSTKPKVRLNPDGTYTNLDTGEVVDSAGKVMAAPEVDSILGKPLDKMTPNELVRMSQIEDLPSNMTDAISKELLKRYDAPPISKDSKFFKKNRN